MSKRKIIKIDEDKCTGCGLCIPNCHEGALQIIDNKARLISDLFCDGLGACVGHCPEGAIEVIEREAEPYDEEKVLKNNIIPKGKNTLKAHLEHLKVHSAKKYIEQAEIYLETKGIANPLENIFISDEQEKVKISNKDNKNKGYKHDDKNKASTDCACPGVAMVDLRKKNFLNKNVKAKTNRDKRVIDGRKENYKIKEGCNPYELGQWPVQLKLLNPNAPYLREADILLAADCSAYAHANFHEKFIKGKMLAIACPKLDDDIEMYISKITSMIDDSNLNTITVITMEVPCCSGLLQIAKNAVVKASRKIPLKSIVMGIDGNIKSKGWL